ncbi:hypothetical protein DFP74_0534 [Nocardiopsis sp. Huas11]|uniref:hypothetical protein n=1 Tax=Nocardiopsis sp. Huas11 TaxID=2183912 RepID=UPI000EB2F5EF|nr:hypothetical protein [Nocardiopsis sp. Huas11]RKS04954.1 hypothetical protein DFP74_0534 [Nocardiopsis sp. Huas11]
MLRAVVSTFLETLTEREFDAPLLALLSSQGFTDIHFIHGGFEFGKDVIAKRLDVDGQTLRQYSIQSKAGDLGQPDWRAVRPQLEECEYNTRAHPSFNADLPRVAVLVTTGTLKGGAPVDAQEFKAACANRGLADFEVWDHNTIVDWLSQDPSLGLTDLSVQDDLVALLGSIARLQVTEPMLERHTRSWIEGDIANKRLARASIETAMICHELRKSQRLDLAALLALHLYRAAWEPPDTEVDALRSTTSDAALRLFTSTATELLDQVEPLLDDPKKLARAVMDVGYVFTYPAVCSRLVETFSLLVLSKPPADLAERATAAVATLAAHHPGTVRPPSDQFAAAVLPTTVVLARTDAEATRTFLRKISQWLLDSHDVNKDGLGLGAIDEEERTQFERLVAGKMTFTSIDVRNSSYLASVVLDALLIVDAAELYDAVLKNMDALRIVATGFRTDEMRARWRRGGPNVYLHPRIDYAAWVDRATISRPVAGTALHSVLLASVTRTRHYVGAFKELIRDTVEGASIEEGTGPAGGGGE